MEDYDKVLDFTNKLFEQEKLDIQSELYRFSVFINVIAHYEMKNFEVMTYYLNSIKRRLEVQERLFKYEKTLLDFLRAVSKYHYEYGKEVELFKEYYDKFSKVVEDPLEKRALLYFDIFPYLRAKIDRKSIIDIVREGKATNVN